ncbi:hypothetical protein H7X87_00040 [Acetobacteraceae bacterium]|nr:hypothetical protein [Candidatus Parcubacteria bacterium]
MQDMVPRGDRSIRNIPISTGHRRPRVQEEVYEEEYTAPQQTPQIPRRRRRRGGLFIWLLLGIIVIAGVLGLLLSTLFAGAKITVHARSATVTPPAALDAKINPGQGELAYTSMTVTRAATTSVQASGTKQVSRAASGVITIYNGAGTEVQRLIANTRFEAPDGKIYRIRQSITVPGGTKAANGTLTPGSTSATVYADSPGAEYNRGETRFTIPGFKEDPKYTTMYAEGKSIVGGFVGAEPSVSTSDLTKAQTMLRTQLESAIATAVSSQIPEGSVPIAGAFDIVYADIAQTPGANNTATLSQSATAAVGIVKINDLAAAIARKTVTGYNGEAVTFTNSAALNIATASTTKPTGVLNLRFSGNPTLIWQYDQNALIGALVGKEKSSFESILKTFEPAITGAEAEVRPFWQRSFPSDPQKITVIAGASQ